MFNKLRICCFMLVLILLSFLIVSCNHSQQILVNSSQNTSFLFTNNSIIFNGSKFVSGNSLSSSVFDSAIASGDFVVIDLRSSNELKDLGIINGTNFNYNFYDSNITSRLNSLNKTGHYLLYCYSGHRSGTVKNYLLDRNFTFVYDLDGGIDAWIKEHRSIERKFLIAEDGSVVHGLGYFG